MPDYPTFPVNAPETAGAEVSKADFHVGRVPVRGDVILSPMAGFSDMPYRTVCREYGSAMSYTEFVSAIALLQKKNEKSLRMLAYRESERPVVFQIFDNDEQRLVEASKMIEQLGPDVIDINMGCSVANVSGRGAGAGLLRDPSKIGRIFNLLSRAVSVPVTGKIRLGWESRSLNYLEVVRAMEENGASLVAVHGRTRAQAYKGDANWDAIAEIVGTAKIPVIGNGDVRTAADIDRRKKESGCAAVMVGRGAIGHPWIFQRRDREQISFPEKAQLIRRHFQLMLEFHGERLALVLIRKHIARYLKFSHGIRDLQQQLVRVDDVARFHALLDEASARLEDTASVAAGNAPLGASDLAPPSCSGVPRADASAFAQATADRWGSVGSLTPPLRRSRERQ